MIDDTLTTQVPAVHRSAEGRARRSVFETFSTWAMACHVLFAVTFLVDPAIARQWLLPASHLFAWAIFVGSHVLVAYYPETMHAPRIAGHQALHGKCVQILIGHEILHVSPLVALFVVPGLWPAAGTLAPQAWLLGTLPALLLGGAYFAWQYKDDNAYAASRAHLGVMFLAALGAGLGANLLALLRL